MTSWLAGLIFILALFLPPQLAPADEWLPAEVKTYPSENGQFEFKVTPRALRDILSYFRERVEKRTSPGQDPNGPTECSGRLVRLSKAGGREDIWTGALVNDVAPVHVIVSNDGQYVVTFDNWHRMGIGDNVVVIYGNNGRLVRTLSLSDLLPPERIKKLPRTVSSIWWSGKHHFSGPGNELVLEIVVDRDFDAVWSRKAKYRSLRLDLTTGDPVGEPAVFLVSRQGLNLQKIVDEPGPFTGTANPPGGSAPHQHPFLTATAMDPAEKDRLRRILDRSKSTAHYILNLRNAGYDVRRQ